MHLWQNSICLVINHLLMNSFTRLLSKQLFIVTFLITGTLAMATDGDAKRMVLEETRKEALERMWVETSARWDRHHEQTTYFESQFPAKADKSDTLRVIRLMGFTDRGEPIYYQTYNLFSAKTLNTNQLWTGGSSELNLNGEGITLNLWDGGALRHTHQEFGDRTEQMDGATTMNGHATHVAGTMISAGMVPTSKGMAPSANLHAYDFVDDETEMIQAAADGAILSNHSYGRATGWLYSNLQWYWHGDTRVSDTIDYKFGFYTEETQLRDEIAYHAPFYLQVYASGNDRGTTGPEEGEEHNVFDHDIGEWVKSTAYRQPDGGYDGYDCLSPLGIGKNVITVGSIQTVQEYTGPESVVLSGFSNTGPTDDGRIKPDVVAKGETVLSTWVDTNTSYNSLTGTSMSAPAITGSLGLLQQLNQELYGSYLRASTIRALLIHTTREAGDHPGPDYLFGWGLADLDAAAQILPNRNNTTIVEERNLVEDVFPTYSRTVYATGQQDLVATLAWTDVPGTPVEPAVNDRTPMLVNDLDLRITRVDDGEVFFPWKLDPDNPSAPATQGDNVVDNVEKIEIPFPDPGEYIVEVTYKDSIVDPIHNTNKRQAFSLIISGIAEREIDMAIDNAYILDSGCGFSENTPAEIVLANKGQQDATEIPVSWEIRDSDGNVVDEDAFLVDEVIAGTDTILEVFPDLTQGLEFELTVSVSYPGDQLPANNTFVREIVSINWPVSENPYHQNFDGITYIEDIEWNVVNANDNASAWMLRIATGPNQWASDGYNSMRYGKLNPGDDGVETMEEADDWLVSSCFYLLEEETYRLRFDYRSWNENDAENLRVLIGTSPDPDDFEEVLLDMEQFTTEDFETAQVEFTVDEEGTHYLAFHVYSEPDHRFVYLDNIHLERIMYNDLAALSIHVDAEGCDFTENTPVEVSFANVGIDEQGGFDIQLKATHPASETEWLFTHTHEGVLAAGDTAYHVYHIDMSQHGMFELQLTTLLETDENLDNDTLIAHVNNTSINLAHENYHTDFNNVETLEEMGWSALTNSGGSTGWRLNNLSGQAYIPPNSLNMYRFEADPDDWAFSNCFVMEEDTWYRIRFHTATRGTDTEERFSFYLMDEPSPDGEVEFIEEVVINTFEYVEKDVIFQAPYSGNFHLGLYTDYTGPNTFQIFVDNFRVQQLKDYDAAVTDIIQLTYGCHAFTDETPVAVVIQNQGIQNLEQAEITLTVDTPDNGSAVYSLTSQESLGIMETDTLVFHADLSQLNTIFDLTAEVILEDDEYPENNVLTGQIRNTTVDLTAGQEYFNDFEMVEIDGHSDLVDPHTGWWYENANDDYSDGGTPITWVMRKNASFALSGEVSMRSGRSLENDADDWLFSNCFIMAEGEHYLLSFYYTGRSTSYEENMSVYLGTAQESETMDQFLWHETFSTGINYQEGVVAFMPPEDGIYYIGFHAHSAADEGWIYLDDFSMKRNHDKDVSLDAIEVLAEPCEFTEETPIRITVRNSGNEAFDHPMTIDYEVVDPSGNILSEGQHVIDQFMAVGQTEHYESVADLRHYGEYAINASVSLPEEIDEPETGNNSLSKTFFSTLMDPEVNDVYVTFEKYDDLEETDWTVHDLNHDGATWDLGVNFSHYAYSGNRVMYYSFSETNQADDWLFSSCARLKADTVYVASYFYRVFDADYPERMKFGISHSPHPDDIIEILDVQEELINYHYRKASYAFTVEEDGLYYFGFHARSDAHQRFIFMDDFALNKARQRDAAVHAITTDTHPCDFSHETPMQAIIKNLGNENMPAGDLDITLIYGDDSQSVTMNTPEVPVLGYDTLYFDLDISEFGRHTLHYELLVDGDEDTGNSKGSINFYGVRKDLSGPGLYFKQDFESIFALREIGWTIHNENQDGRYWGLRLNDPGLAHSGSNYIVYFMGSQSGPADDWAISGCYTLEGERKYKAAFYNQLGSGSHNLRIAAGTQPLADHLEEVVWEETGMTDSQYEGYHPVGGVFEAWETGTYYFGIHQFSPMGSGSSIADDFIVIAQPDILPLDVDDLDTGDTVTIEALGSDSLQWFADEDLTEHLGDGTTLEYTISGHGYIDIYAAENVFGIMGPADVITLQVSVGIDEAVVPGEIKIYPNPARDQIRILLDDRPSRDLTVTIKNILGDVVKRETFASGNEMIINLSSLPGGSYFVIVSGKEHRWTARFIKQP